MRTKPFVLTDLSKRIHMPNFSLSAKDLGGKNDPSWSIIKTTLRGGLSEGVEIIEVNNGALSFVILPTRGMGLWKGEYRGIPVGWESPVRGPIHPAYVNSTARGGLGWLTGCDEMMVRCGLESNGPPVTDRVLNNQGNPVDVQLTLHGRIANIPAWFLSVSIVDDVITVKGITDETGLFHPRFRMESVIETKIGSNTCTMKDTITNMKSTSAELQLLYHCNFGQPFLGKHSKMIMPLLQVAPRDAVAAKDSDTYNIYKGPTAGYVEQCYYYTPLGDKTGRTCALLRNSAATKGVAVRFNTRQLPCFTLWKNTAAISDGYVTGLEPATNYPNPKPFERSQGRVVSMRANGRYSAEVSIEVHDTARGVAGVEKEIAQIQKRAKPVVHQQPMAGLSL